MITDALKIRANLLRAKMGGQLDFLPWPRFLGCLSRSTTRWPFELFAVPEVGDSAFVRYKTPLGELWGPHADREALGGTVIEILGGVYEDGEVRVRPGDTVIDLGANLGAFTALALQRGAARIIAFEAHPGNAECLRRSFAREIAEMRVHVCEAAVWSENTTLRFSGQSLTGQVSATGISIPAVTVDDAVATLGIERVHFMKADIEGAERHALQGARGTLSKERPKLAFCIYHYPDDPEVISGLVHAANSYRTRFDATGRYIYCW